MELEVFGDGTAEGFGHGTEVTELRLWYGIFGVQQVGNGSQLLDSEMQTMYISKAPVFENQPLKSSIVELTDLNDRLRAVCRQRSSDPTDKFCAIAVPLQKRGSRCGTYMTLAHLFRLPVTDSFLEVCRWVLLTDQSRQEVLAQRKL